MIERTGCFVQSAADPLERAHYQEVHCRGVHHTGHRFTAPSLLVSGPVRVNVDTLYKSHRFPLDKSTRSGALDQE